jgi:hypothetical protein
MGARIIACAMRLFKLHPPRIARPERPATVEMRSGREERRGVAGAAFDGGVAVAAGDTKVVERGAADRLYAGIARPDWPR